MSAAGRLLTISCGTLIALALANLATPLLGVPPQTLALLPVAGTVAFVNGVFALTGGPR